MSDAILADAEQQQQQRAGASGTLGASSLPSDAGMPPAGGRAARLGPAPGEAWFEGFTEHYSKGRWRRMELRFTDIHGRALQVDPMQPTLKASGAQRLKLKYDEPLSNFAFTFNLRRCATAAAAG